MLAWQEDQNKEIANIGVNKYSKNPAIWLSDPLWIWNEAVAKVQSVSLIFESVHLTDYGISVHGHRASLKPSYAQQFVHC